MGADLYIQTLSDECRKVNEPLFNAAVQRRDDARRAGNDARADVVQKEVSHYYEKMFEKGYFRDSYNGTSLFALLGKSYWQDLSKMLNRKRELTPSKAKLLLAEIKAAKVPRLTKSKLSSMQVKVENTGEYSVKEWQKYFDDKHANFCEFLQTAIDLKQPIYCSI